MSDANSLGQQLDTKVAEVRQAIADTVGEVGDQVNQKLDELQSLVASVSAEIDRRQGQTSTE